MQNGGPPLWVNVLFNPGFEIHKKDTANIAEAVGNLVTRTLLPIGGHVTLRPTGETWESFPKEVAYIEIYRCHEDEDPSWNLLSVGAILPITAAEIQNRIRSKESKLHEYRARSSEIWLLIVTDGFRISSTVEVTSSAIEYRYTAGFDRVFFFWNFDGRFVELKLARGS